MKLSKLLARLERADILSVTADLNTEISGISYDSRKTE